jgi:hypothetical protein
MEKKRNDLINNFYIMIYVCVYMEEMDYEKSYLMFKFQVFFAVHSEQIELNRKKIEWKYDFYQFFSVVVSHLQVN